MTDIARLGLFIDSRQVVTAGDDLDRFSGRARQAGVIASRLRTAMMWAGSFVGFASLSAGISQAIGRLQEAERVTNRLNAVLRATGREGQMTVDSVRRFADEMQLATGTAADEVVAAAARLATFETITGDAFEKAIRTAIDLSEVYGGTLATNIEAVARALEDPIQGMAMLQRQGFKLTEEQKRLVQQMVAVGDVAGWQKIIFDQLSGSAGAAEAAYGGLRRALGEARYALERLFEALVSGVSGAGVAERLLLALTAVLNAMAGDIDRVIGVVAALATLMAIRLVPAIMAATSATIAFTAALARNPFGLIAIALAAVVADLVRYRNEFIRIGELTTTIGNVMLVLWQTIARSLEIVLTWLTGIHRVMSQIITLDWSSIGRTLDDTGKRMLQLADEIKAAWRDAFNVQPSMWGGGDAGDYIPGRPGGPPNVPGRLTGELKQQAEAYEKLVRGARLFISEQELEARVLGFTEQEANRLRYEMELLNKAKEAGIPLTAARTSELKSLAAQMAEAEAHTKALKDAFDFAKGTTQGFFGEINRGIQQGKSLWESFSNAALNALNRISDKLIQMAVDSLWQNAFPGGGGGLLGLIGGLFGGGASAGTIGGTGGLLGGLFDRGGYTGPGPASQPAGIVHAGEYVFSKASVDRIGVGYLDSLHRASRGYMDGGHVQRMFAPANSNLRGYRDGGYVPAAIASATHGNAAVAQRLEVDVTVGWSRSADGNLKPFVEEVSTRTAGAVVDSAAPAIIKASVASSESQVFSKMRASNVRGTRY